VLCGWKDTTEEIGTKIVGDGGGVGSGETSNQNRGGGGCVESVNTAGTDSSGKPPKPPCRKNVGDPKMVREEGSRFEYQSFGGRARENRVGGGVKKRAIVDQPEKLELGVM